MIVALLLGFVSGLCGGFRGLLMITCFYVVAMWDNGLCC